MPVDCSSAIIHRTPVTWSLRLYRTLFLIRPTKALNCTPPAKTTGTSPLPDSELAANLKRAINRIKAEAIDPATGRVDYAGLRDSDTFHEYERAAYALHAFNSLTLPTTDARKAFWINLYNALIVHAVIAYGVRKKITEVGGVFERAAYIVGGYRFSADDIEHGILRANAGHPFLPGPRFHPDDPRRQFALDQLDPRIHFTLNCGAESCPPIGFYDADHLDHQLALAAQHFTQHGVSVDQARGTVRLSPIFSWYARDFGGKWWGYRDRAALLAGIAPYMQDEADQAALRKDEPGLRVSYTRYNWALNH